LLPAVITPPVASALAVLESLLHEGPLGGKTVLKPTTSACPSVQIEPNLDLTIPLRYKPPCVCARHEPGLLMTDGKFITVAVRILSPLAGRPL
jgi:hypothetical protein